MIKDIKKDSEKFERERKEKLTKYKQEQAKKPLANNKRKMETAEPKREASELLRQDCATDCLLVAYVDSKAHTQMLERFEHNELLRQQSETPASNTSGGSRGFRPPSVNAPVPPPSRNSDTAYSVGSPGYLSQPATTRAPGSFTPEYSQTTTPATELSRTSADDRKPYDNRQYAQSAAKSEEQSPIYPFQAQQLPVHPGPAPANIRRTYQDTPPPQQVARYALIAHIKTASD